MMKFAYVLVCSNDDFYCEQTLVSISSLKWVSPNAKIILLVDDKTDLLTTSNFQTLKSLVDEYVVERFENSISNVVRSRSLKTRLRLLVNGDFLYVDSDTVWASSIDESDFSQDVMAVLDSHCSFDNHPLKREILKEFEVTGCNPCTNEYVNGGVLYAKDTERARRLFSVWHDKWIETSASGCCIDMPSLNYAVKTVFDNERILLPDSYNVQISRSWEFFSRAKIIHFFTGWMNSKSEPPYLFQKRKFWEEVKKTGLSEDVLKYIRNPLSAFDGPVRIFDNVDMELQKTAIYGLLRDMFEKYLYGRKSKFGFLEKIVKKIVSKK